MEAHSLVGVRSVIVVPVQQRRGCLRRQAQRMHAQHAADIDLAGTRKQVVAHHAHDRARHDAKVLLDRGPALHRADGDLGLAHPALDHRGELRHLQQRLLRHAAGLHVLLDRRELALRGIVAVLHARDAPQHFRKIERLNRNALRLQQFFAVANGVERRGTRANRTDAQVLQPIDHAANGRKPLQVFGKLRRVRALPYAS